MYPAACSWRVVMKRILSDRRASASLKSYMCTPGMPKTVSTPCAMSDSVIAWPVVIEAIGGIPAACVRGRDGRNCSVLAEISMIARCAARFVRLLDHARHAGRSRGGCIRIKGRGDGPHQQAARRSELDAAVAHLNQSIACQSEQPLQFGGEILLKGNAVPAFDGRHIDAAVTHDLVDDVLSQPIVFGHAHAAMRRKRAARNRGLVVLQRFVVLDIQVADLTDGAHAEVDEITVRMSRIALKAAVQAAVLLREGKAVGG